MRVCRVLVILFLFGAVISVAIAQESQVVIELKNDSAAERLARQELERLLSTYDLSAWLFTKRILIEQRAIPHSHPVLTMNSRVDDPLRMLSTFLHEQIHRSLSDWPERTQATEAAIAELKTLFPVVPAGGGYGARDANSTYLHLLVCHLELKALAGYIGEPAARQVLDSMTHYKWIYATILSDAGEKIAEVVKKHRLNEYPAL